jgi:phage baseplate assembly protein W
MANQFLGKDIRLFETQIQFTSNDFSFVEDKNNLYQAILVRLQTIKGEYFVKNYGSNLNDVFGQPRNELLKSRVIGYVSECLLQEPRIDSIENIEVEFIENTIDKINIKITVIPINENVPLNLIFPLFLS